MPHSLSTIVFFILMIGQTLLATAADDNREFFVFLTTGKSTEGVPRELIQQKQAAHLENFGRLAKLGTLTAAGPCADPNKKTRGIVFINATSIEDAESMFSTDPYVSEGYMKAELHESKTVAGKLHLVLDTVSLQESVIVIITQGSAWTDSTADSDLTAEFGRFVQEQFEAGRLGFAAQFTKLANNDSHRVAVMIFRGKDVAAVSKLIEMQQPVRDKKVTFAAFPQYLAEGAIKWSDK